MKDNNAAFLWDESFLWGLMAFRALKGLNLPFDLIRAEDIKNGALDACKLLFVPGGWASNKSRALGDRGMAAIQGFVAEGGNYLGFCGGAGLATKAKGGLGLLNVTRRPTKERVPSFSGPIGLHVNQHPVWDHLPGERNFNAWWPSQFVIEDESVRTLASYGDPLREAFSSDLNVGDVEDHGSWEALEKLYGIKLDPKGLMNEPAVLEGTCGRGKVILSLVHFDTPGDAAGLQVFMNLWEYLGGNKAGKSRAPDPGERTEAGGDKHSPLELNALCADLISLGERNFLWFWRNSMLLQWKRGVRGLEYNTLYIMTREIDEILRKGAGEWNKQKMVLYAEKINERLGPFVHKAKKLLVLERHQLQEGKHITYERSDNQEIQEMRAELFGGVKSHGGMFKNVIDEIDAFLYLLLKGSE